MEGLIINADSQSLKLLKALAEKLGAKVTSISKSEIEDFALGKLMDQEKTGEIVSRDSVFKYLGKK